MDAKWWLRIVDHHLVVADHVVLRVVTGDTDTQTPDVFADVNRHDDGSAARIRVMDAVDEELDPFDRRSSSHRHMKRAMDETLGLLRDSDRLRLKRDREEKNDER